MQTADEKYVAAEVRPSGGRTDAPFARYGDAPGQPDPVARGRKGPDKRIAATYPAMPPLVDNVPADGTPLDDALAVVARQRPGLAAWLKYRHNHERLHMQRLSLETAERERRTQEAVNAKAAARNANIEELAAQAREKANADLAAIALEEAAVSEMHAAAESGAAEGLASIGAPYDPADPSEREAIRSSGAIELSSAVTMGLPAPGGADRLYMPEWVGWYCSAVVGLLVGMSLLIVTHTLRPDTVARHPALAAVGAAVGLGIALAGKWAVRLLWARVGQYYVVRRSAARWLRAITVATAATGAILGADIALEMRGLLALAGLQARMAALGSAGGTGSQDDGQALLFLCVAFTVTGAYVLHSAAEGYLKGRDAEVRASATAAAHMAEVEHDRARRGDPGVRAAQRALSDVRVHRRRLAGLAERAASVRADCERQVASLEAARLPEDEPFSAEGRLLVQDGVDDARSAGVAFTERLESALAEAEGGRRLAFRAPASRGKVPFWRRWFGR